MRKLCKLSAVLCLLACRQQPVLRLTTEKTVNGWAYRITHKGKPLIYQENIPAIPGLHPFKSRNDAQRTGELVLNKLENHAHPALSIREIDSLQLTR
ncbi:DUF4907 domain-containing protein [Chitinophaga sp. GCM10012297]|uniref:DUF4907 domain-containing protein n=1 Tax=Chitinophaga chungangae TaxID=2821488 RepID=A0ABS3Y8R1_9BACT|nr:DUF4907 domain-containing protein [Chitinophaga chungangae]MBO9151036.1 DUF4907 domain-containing protein [Chitinophaga chungangae]